MAKWVRFDHLTDTESKADAYLLDRDAALDLLESMRSSMWPAQARKTEALLDRLRVEEEKLEDRRRGVEKLEWRDGQRYFYAPGFRHPTMGTINGCWLPDRRKTKEKMCDKCPDSVHPASWHEKPSVRERIQPNLNILSGDAVVRALQDSMKVLADAIDELRNR